MNFQKFLGLALLANMSAAVSALALDLSKISPCPRIPVPNVPLEMQGRWVGEFRSKYMSRQILLEIGPHGIIEIYDSESSRWEHREASAPDTMWSSTCLAQGMVVAGTESLGSTVFPDGFPADALRIELRKSRVVGTGIPLVLESRTDVIEIKHEKTSDRILLKSRWRDFSVLLLLPIPLPGGESAETELFRLD